VPSSGQSPPPAETDAPTPTPAGTERIWADVNCSGSSDPIDSLLILRHDAGLAVNVPDGCPQPDDMVDVGLQVPWSDADCSGTPNAIDSLKVLRKDSGQNVTQPADCPEIGAVTSVVELG
jgi:hypothetical protein